MKIFRGITYLVLFFFLGLLPVVAQKEEDDAAVTSETVESDFQQHFFEALKERAIENYGKAIDHLLECKMLDADNGAVDYELGINYLSAGLFEDAENYLLAAVEKEPENRWYSEALFKVYKAQNKTDEAIYTAEKLAKTKDAFKESLVYLYSKNSDYEKALAQLDTLDQLYGHSDDREQLRVNLKAMQKRKTQIEEDVEELEATEVDTGEEEAIDAIEKLELDLMRLNDAKQYTKVLELAEEALASYPTQPFIYYMHGVANKELKQYDVAIESLDMALSFLIDDVVLEKRIYTELAACHKQLGNIQKEQEYLHKAKSI